jgi:hypothetical protein
VRDDEARDELNCAGRAQINDRAEDALVQRARGIAASDMDTAAKAGSVRARRSILCQTTSATPSSPSPIPSHWRPRALVQERRGDQRRDQRL